MPKYYNWLLEQEVPAGDPVVDEEDEKKRKLKKALLAAGAVAAAGGAAHLGARTVQRYRLQDPKEKNLWAALKSGAGDVKQDWMRFGRGLRSAFGFDPMRANVNAEVKEKYLQNKLKELAEKKKDMPKEEYERQLRKILTMATQELGQDVANRLSASL